ncbi:class I SAM-dependent rRNA methyltransferase [Halobacteriovorax sp. GFR7]|uniref:class I SAM-dependent rRNA methyltransferase n=1 Tax=unclassified Halobacteriovorax TaxID=2639665 RepID=UPI003D98FA07
MNKKTAGRPRIRTPRVELHPASVKYIFKGHPWITKDKYSLKFPKGSPFITAKLDEVKNDDAKFVVMLNDPTHDSVLARIWRIGEGSSHLGPKEFYFELRERMQASFEARGNIDNRENYYLAFGESDYLPGLFIIRLKDRILIQFYANFWNHFESDVLKIVKDFYPKDTIWVQKRNLKRKKEFYCATNKQLKEDNFIIEEFGVKYQIKLNQFYDIGIYTDMAAIRDRVKDDFDGKSVLNLYSYTGAYSLFALKQGATDVTSVDLSQKYLDWLQENLVLNEMSEGHESLCMPTIKALEKFKAEGKKFDLIICDPPSASSDGKKVSKAIDAYKDMIPLFDMILNKGGKAHIFLNTHSITRKKFENKIKEYIGNRKISITGSLKLTGDCPSLKGFIEGDYLKGLTLLKK